MWLQYMISMLKQLIKTERLGNWSLHLQTVSEILPYLTTSRHKLYSKLARVYLQHIMPELGNTHLDVFNNVQDGF